MPSNKIDKKEVIRQAALQLFLQQGFAATSTDAICQQAGVSKETLYRHFSGKTALLVDILQNLTVGNSLGEKSRTVWQQALTERQLEPALLEVAQAIMDTLMNPVYLGLLKIIMAEGQNLSELKPFIRESIPRQGLLILTGFFSQAQQAGLVKPGSPQLLARFFVGPLLTYLIADGLLAPDRQPQPPSAQQIQEIVSNFARFALITNP